MTFDNDGLLAPAEGIPVSIDELYNALVRPFPNSQTRARLYHEWMKYNQMLRQELGVGFE